MQDLHGDAAAGVVHGLGDDAVLVDFPGPAELAAEGLEPAGEVGRDAAGDHQPDAAFGALAEIGRQAREIAAAVLQAGVHRAHQHAVGQRAEAEVQRREQVRIGVAVIREAASGSVAHHAPNAGSKQAAEIGFWQNARTHFRAPQRTAMSHTDIRSAIRPEPDQAMVDIADYVIDYQIQSPEAFATARYMLLDSLGCAMLAMKHPSASSTWARWCPAPACRRREGPRHLLRARPGAGRLQHRRAGALARLQRHLAGGRVGPPFDNLGAILAVADYVSRKAVREGGKPVLVRDVLDAAIKAHEIQGQYAIKNSFNRVGLDHVILVRLASTALATTLLGGGKEEIINAVSHSWLGRRRAARLPPRAAGRPAQELGRGRRLPPRRHPRAQRHEGLRRLPERADRAHLGLLRRRLQGQGPSSSSAPSAAT
jgi:hypothetical protein